MPSISATNISSIRALNGYYRTLGLFKYLLPRRLRLALDKLQEPYASNNVWPVVKALLDPRFFVFFRRFFKGIETFYQSELITSCVTCHRYALLTGRKVFDAIAQHEHPREDTDAAINEYITANIYAKRGVLKEPSTPIPAPVKPTPSALLTKKRGLLGAPYRVYPGPRPSSGQLTCRVSASESASKLWQRYGTQIEGSQLETILAELKQWVDAHPR